jgi:hypothetical protein
MGEWIQHEYVHYLRRSRDRRRYPVWLDEGMAELLSTVKVEGETFELGRPPRFALHRLNEVRWLDYERVLAVRDPRELPRWQRVTFYHQSWLLLHYLSRGRPNRSYPLDANEYLQRLANGEAADIAFSESFDLEPASLESVLRRYGVRTGYSVGRLSGPPEVEVANVALGQFDAGPARTGLAPRSFGMRTGLSESRLDEPLPEADVAVRPLRPDEVAANIGMLSLRLGELDSARRYFEGALSLHNGNDSAHAGIAELKRRETQ